MGKEKKMFIGLTCNYAVELKFLIIALLAVFSLLTVLQFLPISPQFSLPYLRTCFSNASIVDIPPPSSTLADEVLPGGIIRRHFHPYGSAAYSFILMSSYRTGPTNFTLIGLSSKPFHLFGRPSYNCLWVPHNAMSPTISTVGYKSLPDWGFGRVYTVVIVGCTFPAATTGGGKLLLAASEGAGAQPNQTVTIEALTEKPQDESLTIDSNQTSPRYDHLYCGSSLFGELSPQRIREWIAYHVMLFGDRSHFVFHDAGGVHEAVMDVLLPWMELGYVTLHDIREQEKFDGFYHNQFLILNDCLNRYRFDAKWIFFFDVDEYLYLPKNRTLKFATDSLAEFSQFMFEQMPMSHQLCLEEDKETANKKWGFEKLVFRDVKKGVRRNRKYAVQPQYVFATGVHLSKDLVGKTNQRASGLIKYFHYHGTVSVRDEPCHVFTNATFATVDKTPFAMDTTIRGIAPTVRNFELKMIGPKLSGTQQ